MEKDNRVYLEDIVDACEKILVYTNGVEKFEFEADNLLQDAVIRNITIIGEAANKLTKDFVVKYPEFPVREAITMRNKLVHDYSFIDSSIVWDTISKNIPQLLELTQTVLKTL